MYGRAKYGVDYYGGIFYQSSATLTSTPVTAFTTTLAYGTTIVFANTQKVSANPGVAIQAPSVSLANNNTATIFPSLVIPSSANVSSSQRLATTANLVFVGTATYTATNSISVSGNLVFSEPKSVVSSQTFVATGTYIPFSPVYFNADQAMSATATLIQFNPDVTKLDPDRFVRIEYELRYASTGAVDAEPTVTRTVYIQKEDRTIKVNEVKYVV